MKGRRKPYSRRWMPLFVGFMLVAALTPGLGSLALLLFPIFFVLVVFRSLLLPRRGGPR